MASQLVVSPSVAARRARAAAFLAGLPAGRPALVVAPTLDASADLVRDVAAARPAGFGWQKTTLLRLAAELARPALAEQGLAPAGALAFEGICARVVQELHEKGALGELERIADKPGLPRALARTATELRLAGEPPSCLPESLRTALEAIARELAAARLTDRAGVLRLAAEALRGPARLPLVECPAALLDVPIASALERELIAALARRSPSLLATAAEGDDRSIGQLERALGVPAERPPLEAPANALERLQRRLFTPEAHGDGSSGEPADPSFVQLSAPGEGRECVEIARLVLREAERGTRFDRMAVLLRAPFQYRPLLEEALARAGIPAHFARGSSRPDPTGRAFLALLSCAAQSLSAARFAEYLSLGEVPDAAADGAPPPAPPSEERFARADDELQPQPPDESEREEPPAPVDPDAAVRAGSLRAPWRWEKLLVEAAVIEGLPRWADRLAGLAAELDNKRDALLRDGDPVDFIDRALADLDALRAFALPLLGELEALPRAAKWDEWLPKLSALASRALRRPARVQQLLAELQPLGPVGPVGLSEVRLVLERRLCDLAVLPAGRRFGKLFVAPVEAARGMQFDVVFAPGLAEKLFPPRLLQDPLLRDAERAAASPELETLPDRLANERLALRLVAGAATRRLVLSWPRLAAQVGRAIVPSFYNLDAAQAATGLLPPYAELMQRAEQVTQARAGWPAPQDPKDAIDEAEHDLALLKRLLDLPDAEARGTARYLLSVNPHLARALRSRGRRFRKRWLPTDGLVAPGAAAQEALAALSLAAKPYSATALQNYAACPYKFLLHAAHRLQPREEPQRIDELDPLSRGSLMHETQFELLESLQKDALLPLTAETMPEAERRLETVLDAVAKRFEQKLYPAIARVWDDGIASIRLDLREWLRRMSQDVGWRPWRFELGFGLPRDPVHHDDKSVREDLPLESGLRLKGSIDLVEESADGSRLRATDYKSGKPRAKAGEVIHGGAVLQPVLYAQALEKLFPGRTVEGGRLWYCTHAGGFEEVPVPLDQNARGSAQLVADAVAGAVQSGFFPAAPRERECEWCDFKSVCGPLAETQAKRKPKEPLQPLLQLRGMP